MNKTILLIAIISLIVSLIQIKFPTFFFNTNVDEDLFYIGQNRNFSIYSWTDLNSVGISFPILISILVSLYYKRKFILPLVIFSDIAVSFLTRTRYIMISGIVALSQVFFNKKISLIRRISTLLIIVIGIFFIGPVAEQFGFNIKEVINNRILEEESDMRSAKARILSFKVFLLKFPEHPFLGVGPQTRPDVVKLLGGEAPLIHIGYLSYLYFYGVTGCFFIFLAIYYLLKDAWFVGKNYDFWGCFYGLLSFCIANLTTVYFNFSEMGIIILVIYLRYYNHKSHFNVSKKNLNLSP
jgi:hypothetical protein